MAIPVQITAVTLTGKYMDCSGQASSGRLIFTPTYVAQSPVASTMFSASQIEVVLSQTGEFSVALVAGDDPDLAAPGMGYLVDELVDGKQRLYNIVLPYSVASEVDISELAPMPVGSAQYAYPFFDNVLSKASNLSDVQSVSTARTNLGLGTAAVRNVGSGAADVAAGNLVSGLGVSAPHGTLDKWMFGTGRLDVMFLGDSLTAYNDTTTGFVNLLRQALQRSYGGDGGRGFIPLWSSTWTKFGTWTAFPDCGPFASCIWAQNDATRTCTAANVVGDTFDVMYLDAAGTGNFDVVVDGGAPVTVTPALSGSNTLNIVKTTVSMGSIGTHTVVVQAPAAGILYFIGGAPYKSTGNVVVHGIGKSSMMSADLSLQRRPDIAHATKGPIVPRLTFVGLQVNDQHPNPTQQTIVNYTARIRTIVQAAKTSGDVCLIIPPDDTSVPVQPIPYSEYEAAQRLVALEEKCAVISMHDLMGTWAEANASGWMTDGVHINDAGNAYFAARAWKILHQN